MARLRRCANRFERHCSYHILRDLPRGGKAAESAFLDNVDFKVVLMTEDKDIG